MQATGIAPRSGRVEGMLGAGMLLCLYTWFGSLSPAHMEALQRVIAYRDFNEIQAIAERGISARTGSTELSCGFMRQPHPNGGFESCRRQASDLALPLVCNISAGSHARPDGCCS